MMWYLYLERYITWFLVLEKNRNGCPHWVWNVFHWQWTFLMRHVYVDVNAELEWLFCCSDTWTKAAKGRWKAQTRSWIIQAPSSAQCNGAPSLTWRALRPFPSLSLLPSPNQTFPPPQPSFLVKMTQVNQSCIWVGLFGLVLLLGGGRGRGVPQLHVNNFYLVFSTN